MDARAVCATRMVSGMSLTAEQSTRRWFTALSTKSRSGDGEALDAEVDQEF